MDVGRQTVVSLVRNPFPLNFSTISGMGAVIQSPPVGVLLLSPSFVFMTLFCPLLDAILLMYVPKNLALSLLALVIKVFSCDRVSFNFASLTSISFFSCFATLLGPQTPTIQSSAYLTYSILITSGLGIIDFIALLDVASLANSRDIFLSTGLSSAEIFFLIL